MRALESTLGLLVLALAAVIITISPVHAFPSASENVGSRQLTPDSLLSRRYGLLSRDDHGHHNHHAAPLTELNETELTMYHAPTPPSYWSIDFEDSNSDDSRYPGLIMLHGLLMSLAFFGALPIGMYARTTVQTVCSIMCPFDTTCLSGIMMRSIGHGWRTVFIILFYGLSVLGCAASSLYTKLTPNM